MQPIPFQTLGNLLLNPSFDNADDWDWAGDFSWNTESIFYSSGSSPVWGYARQEVPAINEESPYRLSFEITSENLNFDNKIVCGFDYAGGWIARKPVGIYTFDRTFQTGETKRFHFRQGNLGLFNWARCDNASLIPLDMVPLLKYNFNSGPGTRYQTWQIDATYSMSRYSNRKDAMNILVKYRTADL